MLTVGKSFFTTKIYRSGRKTFMVDREKDKFVGKQINWAENI